MTHPDEQHHQQIRIADGDADVSAELITSPGRHGTAQVIVNARSGHLRPGLRRQLIDEVLDSPEVRDSALLAVSVPLGDGESLLEIAERCEDVVVRAAGVTALVDARLRVDTVK